MTAVLTFKPLGIALLWLCHDMIAIGLSPFICRRTSLLLEHRGKTPNIHPSAYIAPTATICGDVTIGENSRVLFGAILVAEGGSVEIGANCIIMENAVIRGTPALQNVPNL